MDEFCDWVFETFPYTAPLLVHTLHSTIHTPQCTPTAHFQFSFSPSSQCHNYRHPQQIIVTTFIYQSVPMSLSLDVLVLIEINQERLAWISLVALVTTTSSDSRTGFLSHAGGGGNSGSGGYRAPSNGYGAPSTSYGASSTSYGAPSSGGSSGYGAATGGVSTGYGAPSSGGSSGYGAPSSGGGSSGYSAPCDSYGCGGGGEGGSAPSYDSPIYVYQQQQATTAG